MPEIKYHLRVVLENFCLSRANITEMLLYALYKMPKTPRKNALQEFVK